MSDSVGKISLDIDLRADLNKQINHIAGNIGNQLSKTIQQHVKGSMNGMKKMMSSYQIPKKTFSMPKKTYSKATNADADTGVEKDELAGLDAVLDNTNAKIDIQKKKLAELKAQMNAGISDGAKAEIEQLERVMQSSEGRIQALTTKLKDLKFSYDNAVSPTRQNKLLDEISKTEMQITGLMNKSDKANQKIIQLESGFSQDKKNALLEKIVNTEASLLRLGTRADKTKEKMEQLDSGMNNTGKGAGKADRPVRKLTGSLGKAEKAAKRTGGAFTSAGSQGNNMAKSFQLALTRILKQVLVFAVLYKAIRGFTSYMGSALKTNNEFMHSLGQIRTNLQVAFAPIYQAILPALNALMRGLATVTAYIASFISAIFGKTYKQSYQAAQGINAARTAMEGYGGAAKKAAKDAKKASLGLAGFDEVNTLAFSDEDAGADDAGGGGAGGGGGGIAPLIEPDMDMSLIDSKMAELLGGVKKFLEPTTESLKNLWKAMDPFKSFVAKGVQDFYNNFLKPVGTWVFGEGLPRFFDALAKGFRSVDWPNLNDSLNQMWKVLTPFAITVGEGLLWFWEKVLVPLGSWTANHIVPIFLETLNAVINILNVTLGALQPLGSWLFEKFLKPMAEWTGGVIISVLELLVGLLQDIGSWIAGNTGIVETMTIILGSFAAAWGIVTLAVGAWSVVAGIAAGVTSILGGAIAFLTSPITIAVAIIGTLIAIGILLWRNWDEISAFLKATWILIKVAAKEAFEAAKKIIIDVMTAVSSSINKIWDAIKKYFKDTWNNIKNAAETAFETIKKLISDKFTAVNKSVMNVWNSIKTFVSNTWNGLKTSADTVFNAIKTTISTIFESVKTSISGVWNGIRTSLSNTWNGIKTSASTIFDNIKEAILGAFNGVKNKMSGIWSDIWSTIKGYINKIIDGFNGMINGMNRLSINVPDWVPGIGGGSIGFSIPNIPKLARGGIVDQPTLAMVGEAGTEAVMPLENNTGWISNLAGQIASQMGPNDSGGEGVIEVLKLILYAIQQLNNDNGDVILKVGETELGRAAAKGINKAQRVSGKLILDI